MDNPLLPSIGDLSLWIGLILVLSIRCIYLHRSGTKLKSSLLLTLILILTGETAFFLLWSHSMALFTGYFMYVIGFLIVLICSALIHLYPLRNSEGKQFQMAFVLASIFGPVIALATHCL